MTDRKKPTSKSLDTEQLVEKTYDDMLREAPEPPAGLVENILGFVDTRTKKTKRGRDMKFWIVKGNPSINDLGLMLEPGESCDWYDPSDQKKNGARKGDGIFFWSSGRDRFLIGLGEMGNPLIRTEDRKYIFELTYLTEPFLDPVTLEELKQDPLFNPDNPNRPYFIIPGPVQTRYPLTDDQAKRLAEMIIEKNPDDENTFDVLCGWFPDLTPPEPEEPEEPEEKEPDADEFPEGKKVYAVHARTERSPELVAKAKQRHRTAHKGALPCSVCGFDFEKNYGPLGKDFAEVHHTVPLSEYEKLNKKATRLEDLVVVCSNCHRMLHRKRPWLTVKELGKLID